MEYINTNLSDVFSVEDVKRELDERQLVLKSGENIKTIDGASILGSGDLPVSTLHDQELVVRFQLGALWPGFTFPEGTSLEVILRKLLCGQGAAEVLPGLTYEELYTINQED